MTTPTGLDAVGPEAEKVIAKPVYALPRPYPLDGSMEKAIKALTVLYGPDLRMHEFGPKFVVYTDGELCHCAACDVFMRKVADLDYLALPGGMIVCSVCGNKRCPHATDHEEECTASNESGQPGSSYPSFEESMAIRAARRDRQRS